MRRVLCAAFFLTIVLSILGDDAISQATANTGVLLGTVEDDSGAVVPGVTLTITNEGTGITPSGRGFRGGLGVESIKDFRVLSQPNRG